MKSQRKHDTFKVVSSLNSNTYTAPSFVHTVIGTFRC